MRDAIGRKAANRSLDFNSLCVSLKWRTLRPKLLFRQFSHIIIHSLSSFLFRVPTKCWAIQFFPTSVLKVHQKYIFSARVGPSSTSLSIMTDGFTSFSIEFKGWCYWLSVSHFCKHDLNFGLLIDICTFCQVYFSHTVPDNSLQLNLAEGNNFLQFTMT